MGGGSGALLTFPARPQAAAVVSSERRAMTRLASAQRLWSWAVFLARPRERVLRCRKRFLLALRKHGTYFPEDLPGQSVRFKQMPELPPRGGIRPRLHAPIDAREGAQRLAGVEAHPPGPHRPAQTTAGGRRCAASARRRSADARAPPLGSCGSITATHLAQGTTRSISPRNFSRRVTFFFPAYSLCAKLICRFLPATIPKPRFPDSPFLRQRAIKSAVP